MDNKRPCCLPTRNVTMSSEYFGPYTPHQRLWKINSMTYVITWRRRWFNRRILPKVCLIINTSKESMLKVLRVFRQIRVFCHIYIYKYTYIYTCEYIHIQISYLVYRYMKQIKIDSYSTKISPVLISPLQEIEVSHTIGGVVIHT